MWRVQGSIVKTAVGETVLEYAGQRLLVDIECARQACRAAIVLAMPRNTGIAVRRQRDHKSRGRLRHGGRHRLVA